MGSWPQLHDLLGEGQLLFAVSSGIKYFGVEPTRANEQSISEISFPTEKLYECQRNKDIVAIALPISIAEMQRRYPDLFYAGGRYAGAPFFTNQGVLEWGIIPKQPSLQSCKSLSPRLVVYGLLAHFLATRRWLFQQLWLPTFCTLADGSCVQVGVVVESQDESGHDPEPGHRILISTFHPQE